MTEQMLHKYHDGAGVLAEVVMMPLRSGDLYVARLLRPGVSRTKISRAATATGESVYVTEDQGREPDVLFSSFDSRQLDIVHDWLRQRNFNVPVANH